MHRGTVAMKKFNDSDIVTTLVNRRGAFALGLAALAIGASPAAALTTDTDPSDPPPRRRPAQADGDPGPKGDPSQLGRRRQFTGASDRDIGRIRDQQGYGQPAPYAYHDKDVGDQTRWRRPPLEGTGMTDRDPGDRAGNGRRMQPRTGMSDADRGDWAGHGARPDARPQSR